jgi:predicted dehydrogenase
MRYAIVGTGARAEMFARAIAVEHADTSALVAIADVNQTRMDAHNRKLAALGATPVPTYQLDPADPLDTFGAMLDREKVDVAVVTSVDATHDTYIVAALDAGRDAVTEKPMTVDVARCRRILDAAERTGRNVTVAFNYRYNPVHERVRELLRDGVIGAVGSVHFEWLLDVRHGADYFRRWHRDRAHSGGLLVHKASHHFDLVNWWLGGDRGTARPVDVYAAGRLFFYGDEAGARHGYARDYVRAHGAPAAADDPFALDLTANPGLRELYLEAEGDDGYLRDRNVFAPGVNIEDDMAVLVRYDTGATMSYHLTAYAPWEGYRVMFNGSHGRLELEVVESDHVSPAASGVVKGASLHGAEAAAERGGKTLTVRPFWRPPYQIDISGYGRAGHGGADAKLVAALFGSTDREADPSPDPLGRSATERDGALALLTGLAANESIASGRAVRVADLLDLS